MKELPVDPQKSDHSAWAISGFLASDSGDDEDDKYRMFKSHEFTVHEDSIELENLEEGKWILVIVQMFEDGYAKQGVVRVESVGDPITTVNKPVEAPMPDTDEDVTDEPV